MLAKFLAPFILWDADTGNGGGAGNNNNTSTGEGGSGGQNNSDGQGQSGNNNNTQTTQTGGGQQAGGSGGQQSGGGTQGGATQTFSQDDLDRIAGKTRKEAMEKFAKDHGFADVKALETAVKAQKEAEEAAKSELQKAQEAAQREKAGREAVEAELKRTKIETAILTKAAELNFASPRDALALLDLAGVQIDEAGKVSGYEKPLDELAKSGRLPLKGQQGGIGNQTRRNMTGGSGGTNNQQQSGPQKPIVRF